MVSIKYSIGILLLIFNLICSTTFAQVQIGGDIDGTSADGQMGRAIDMSDDGTRIVVASPFDNTAGANAGLTQVYELINGDWVQIGSDILGRNLQDQSGEALSISGDGNRIIIGSYRSSEMSSLTGHTRMFEWSGNDWVQMGAVIYGEASSAQSGFSVSNNNDGSRIAIGTPRAFNGGSASGQVRVYEWINNAWTQLGDDIDGENPSDLMGYAVSLDNLGNRIVVSAPLNDNVGQSKGQLKVLEWSGASWNQIGSSIYGEDEGETFGNAVSLNGDGTRFASAATFNLDSNEAGEIRVFEWTGSSWEQMGDTITGEASLDRSGWSLDLNEEGNRLIIGAIGNDDNGEDSGHARIYDFRGNSWIKSGNDIDGVASFDESGWSVAVNADGTKLAVGARAHDGIGGGSGHVRVFEGPILSVGENESLTGNFYIYPNPSKNLAYLHNFSSVKTTKASIYDQTGRLVKMFTSTEMSTPLPLNIKNLQAGVYIVLIEAEGSDQRFRLKLIKE